MILFIDTEWADVRANELVSLALVSDCGRLEFYAERDPLPAHPTQFVRDVVFPLLERGDRAMDDGDFTRRLHEFFGTAQAAAKPHPVTVAYDNRNDLDLLGIAIEGFNLPETPPRPAFRTLDLSMLGGSFHNMVNDIFDNDAALRRRRHHALIDARVNRDAYARLHSTAQSPA